MATPDLKAQVETIAQQAQAASLSLATLSEEEKNKTLLTLADLIVGNTAALIEENKKDLVAGESNGLSQPMLERLTFTEARITAMAEGVRQVAALPDPVGEELEQTVRPNGIDIRKVRVPIGVIGIIYESRPNVTIDCAVLCLKSGNASILRGGKEAFHSNTALAGLITQALQTTGVHEHAVQLIPTVEREALNYLIRMDQYVHCIIPRGGEQLIRFVTENGSIPVIKHYTGVCSVYVDAEADLEMASAIAINAKCQRPSVCNAAENLFVHQSLAASWLPEVAAAFVAKGVELRGDERTVAVLEEKGIACNPATEDDFYTEYIDLILSIQVVDTVEESIAAINRYSSKHSDAIVTKNEATAQKFLRSIDSSTVYWNASTRFTDGFEFGLGAEIGISTDKLHARGPMGLRELCTYKYLVYGTGQIRE